MTSRFTIMGNPDRYGRLAVIGTETTAARAVEAARGVRGGVAMPASIDGSATIHCDDLRRMGSELAEARRA